jgi:hypothetical protein
MAKELPSDEALERFFMHMDVDVTIPYDGVPNAPAHSVSASGTVTRVSVDGEGGVSLTVDCEVPTEDIPDL